MDQELLTSIKKLLQRLTDEDWSNWLKEEKQFLESLKAPDEVAIAIREGDYNNLRKKIVEYSIHNDKNA